MRVGACGWVWVCSGADSNGCTWMFVGIRVYAQGCAVGQVYVSVHWCAQVCVEVRGCLRVCVWDEFSEYLLENRVPTSADFNTYPIRIIFQV